MTSYIVAVVAGACSDGVTSPPNNSAVSGPRFDYTTTSLYCAFFYISGPIFGDPADYHEIKFLNGTITDTTFTYHPSTQVLTVEGTVCNEVTYYWPTMDHCDLYPGDTGCQPVLPILDEWIYGDESGGGGGGGGGNPTFSITVSACYYGFSLDANNNQYLTVDSLRACQRGSDTAEVNAVKRSMMNWLRPEAEFTGPDSLDAVNECRDMRKWLDTALAHPDSFGVSVAPRDINHQGHAIVGGRIAHLNASLFRVLYLGNSTWKSMDDTRWGQLLAAALHEATHAYGGRRHLNPDGSEQKTLPYTSVHFRRISNIGGVNQCVR